MQVKDNEEVDIAKLTLSELEFRFVGTPIGNNIASILVGIEKFYSGKIVLYQFAKGLAITANNLAHLAGWYDAIEKTRSENEHKAK